MSLFNNFRRNYFSYQNLKKGIGLGMMVFAFYHIFKSFTGGVIFELGRNTFREFVWFLISGIFFFTVFKGWSNFIKAKFNFPNPILKIAISALGTTILLTGCMFLLRFGFEVILIGESLTEFWSGENPEWYKIGLVLSSIAAVSLHFVQHLREQQKKVIAQQTFKAGAASAQLDALKSQLDPHFLFNSLNVLTGLIEENPIKAQDFTAGLSKVYRYVLEQKDKEWISVNEELDFARTYLQLLQMRFENSLMVELPETSFGSDVKIVPLSLQLLIENAVKHNEASSLKPLNIKVYQSGEQLLVVNNFQPKENLGRSSGFGLTNIRQRYALFTDRPVEVVQTAQSFRVALPLLTHKKSIMQTTEINQSYLNARKRVDDLKEFYGSLISYMIVIPFLIFINYRTYWEFQWFWFPMLGWGIGLAFQAAKVYFPASNWEDRKFKQFLEEERRKMRQ